MVEFMNKLLRKYQTPFGIAIWGFTAPGQAKEILVNEDGRIEASILSHFSLDLWMIDKTVTPAGLYSKISDCQSFPVKMIFFNNQQDVDVYVDVLQGPTSETVEYPIRRNIKIPTGEKRWALLVTRTPFLKLYAKTLTEPTLGTFSSTLAKWGI